MISTPDFVVFFIVYTLINGLVFFVALIRPFGDCAAMQVFRHKTRKLKFYLVQVCAMLHIALIIWFLMYFMN